MYTYRHLQRLYKAPTDYTKPQKDYTKSPNRLHNAPKDYTKT